MEICQHCGMYMKPFMTKKDGKLFLANCEFCGEVIARVIEKKWVKMLAKSTDTAQQKNL